jgi:peptide/nickel transport system ATP-binding protein
MAGKIQEIAEVGPLFADPKHPYTKGLLSSACRVLTEKQERLQTIPGIVPSILNIPKGCKFAERCSVREERCCGERNPSCRRSAPGTSAVAGSSRRTKQ